MKLSLKLQDQHHHHNTTAGGGATTQAPLLLRAKIPITVFGLPFLSAFSATDNPSNLSLSLRTNFPSAPSLQLSYNSTTTASGAATAAPLTLTLKSGVNLYGSPNNSPLIISANFSFSPNNYNPNPTFSLQFKPQIGSFSFRKTTFSNPNPSPKPNSDVGSFGFVPLEKPVRFKDLTMESFTAKDSIFSGILVMAKTELPVTKRVALNLRWGVNVPGDYGKQLPYLRVNKIGIERIDEVKEEKVVKDKGSESNLGELEMVKGMCSWMKRELDSLKKENREMKNKLEEVNSVRNINNHGYGLYGANNGGKKSAPVVEKSGGSEEWRSKKGDGGGEDNGWKELKKGGEDNGWKELKKNGNSTRDVESELQRAIMAAST